MILSLSALVIRHVSREAGYSFPCFETRVSPMRSRPASGKRFCSVRIGTDQFPSQTYCLPTVMTHPSIVSDCVSHLTPTTLVTDNWLLRRLALLNVRLLFFSHPTDSLYSICILGSLECTCLGDNTPDPDSMDLEDTYGRQESRAVRSPLPSRHPRRKAGHWFLAVRGWYVAAESMDSGNPRLLVPPVPPILEPNVSAVNTCGSRIRLDLLLDF